MNNRENTLLRPALRAVMLLFLSVMTHCTYAQYNSMWYTFDPSVKNYATKMVPGTNRESVMAGTAFGSTGLGIPHFMKLDDGYPAPLAPMITAQNLFRDNDFIDQRTVDVVARDNDEYFMVILAREDPANPMAKDKIKVIHTNNAAALVQERVFYDPTADYDLYPLSALYNPANNYLYICGYATTLITVHPDMPDEHTPKHAFIMSIDISNPSDASTWTVRAMKYFESSPATNNNPELDWDIAMRMQIIEYGNNADDIFLTGSVNAWTGPTSPVGSCVYHVRSATMVHILDPNSLDDQYGNSRHFIDRTPNVLVGNGMMEYGVALVQDPDKADGLDNYIVSNIYAAASDGCGNKPNDWYNTIGFNSKTDRIAITHANEDYETTVGGGLSVSRLILDPPGDGLYALQAFESKIPTSTTSGFDHFFRFCIGGMAYGTPNTSPVCSSQLPPTQFYNPANIVPFIYDIEIRWQHLIPVPNNNILGNVSKRDLLTTPVGSMIEFYINTTGTGTPGNPNSYADLGGGLSHIFYGPKMMDRNISDPDESVVFNAPKYQDGLADGTVSQKLGLKTLFVDGSATGGAGWYELDGNCHHHCDVDDANDGVENVSDWEETPHWTDDAPSAFTASISEYQNGQCTDNPPVMKPAGVSEVKTNIRTTMHPNPANMEVNIRVTGAVSGDAEILLVNIYGQKLAVLYQGNAEQLSKNTKLQLPHVPTGMYMVQVYTAGQRIYSGKLKVQQ